MLSLDEDEYPPLFLKEEVVPIRCQVRLLAFNGLNRIRLNRGTPKQCFGYLSLDGTILVIDNIVLTTRDLFVGQTLGFYAPMGFISKYTPTTSSTLEEEIIDADYSVIHNKASNLCIRQNRNLDVHFSSRMRHSKNILECNCALLDDSRVVCIRDTYKEGDYLYKREGSTNRTELVLYIGNWSIIN